MHMDFYEVVLTPNEGTVNFLSVLIAAILYYCLGYLWYSPWLFGHHINQSDIPDSEKEYSLPGIWSYIGEFIIALIISLGLAILIQPNDFNAFGGLVVALLVWSAFVATTHFSAVLWARKSFKSFCLHSGFILVGFALIGAVLGWLS